VEKNICGHNKGVVGRVNSKLLESDPEVPYTFHCVVHQEALCCKVLSWREIMDTVISVINFIRKNRLTHRQFEKFLEDI
jgi:hypothetical protein